MDYDHFAEHVASLCAEYLRPPRDSGLGKDGTPAWDFDPPLSGAEQTTFDAIMAMARRDLAKEPPATFTASRSQLQTLRDLRQMGRNAFMALTAAERDRALYDAQTSTTIILLALLREP